MRQNKYQNREKQRKYEEALDRQEARDKRTHQEQLKLLDEKFGEGQGAKKERARLASLIEAGKNKNSNKQKEDQEPKEEKKSSNKQNPKGKKTKEQKKNKAKKNDKSN